MKRVFFETRGVCSEDWSRIAQPAMNRSYHRDTSGEPSEEGKLPPMIRQTNGAISGEPPVRHSWRPCQMLNQDGGINPHHPHYHTHRHQPHHNHPPAGRGPPRHRRRHPSSQGQGQSPAQGPGLVPAPDVGASRDADPHRDQQPRPAVTRYRRHGDPNPRLRGPRRRQPVAEMQDSFPGEGSFDVQPQSQPSVDPMTEDRGPPHQTPVAVVTPTHLSDDASVSNMHSPPPEAEENGREPKNDCDQEWLEVQEKEDCTDPCSPTSPSSCGKDDIPTVDDRADKHEERVEKDCIEESNDAADADADTAAQKCEITDLCSDTESAASLSMDGPLHSPPPLQSPTPPSSPDVPHFPKMDNFSEDTSFSTLPDIDLLPEDDEDRSESHSPSLFTSGSESYPKTYADFCSESYQKSEPVLETQLESKVHPNSFPEPLKTSYPDSHREPQKQSGWRIAPNETQQTFTSLRHENVQKGAMSPSTKGCQSARRQGRDQGSLPSPADRSVGCRLHHYDGKSDSEGDSVSKSPVTENRGHTVKKAETRDKSPVSAWSTSSEAQEEQDQAEEGSKDTGDAIIVAIKDIRNAIEEVKIKAVRSPYTPDKPEEPIWVMRREVSPTEEGQSAQTAVSNHAYWAFMYWKKKKKNPIPKKTKIPV